MRTKNAQLMITINLAVVQATPIVFNLEATIEKTKKLINKASEKEADLIVFPESFIPGYPRGLTFGAVVGRRNEQGRELYQKYWDNSLEENDPYFKELCNAAKQANAYVAIGATERDAINGSLFCTYFYFAPDGKYLGKHRKIKPTGTERIIWAEGAGDTLTAIDSEIGKFGGLICWENYMPLARYSLYRKGIEIYLAPTADARDTWQSTLQHIALESRSFVVGCNQFVREDDYPNYILKEVQDDKDLYCRGGSIVFSPLGKIIAGPLYDQETILTATINKEDITKAKMDFDVIGHYSRNDIFKYEATDQPDLIKHRLRE